MDFVFGLSSYGFRAWDTFFSRRILNTLPFNIYQYLYLGLCESLGFLWFIFQAWVYLNLGGPGYQDSPLWITDKNGVFHIQ